MEILYVYSNCSKAKYEELFKNSKLMILLQAQKYHSLLIEGLHDNGVKLTCVSGLPINRPLIAQVFIKGSRECVDGIQYYYYGFINLPFFRQVSLFLNGFWKTFLFSRRDGKDVVICDFLNVSNASGALLASKFLRIKSVCIVTDIPGFMADDDRKRHGLARFRSTLFNKIYQYILFRFDAYVYLTGYMNDIINHKNRPFIVLEGHVDRNMESQDNRLELKSKIRTVLYAGSIKRIYGIDRLAQAFVDLNPGQCELHIFGDGDFASELIGICAANPQIKYLGVKPNHVVIQEELKAVLLVNPRPTHETYTKYSFPSKNMEYMASGTPLLTTRLPGMPDEYLDHVYLIEDESAGGLSKALKEALSRSSHELHEKGMRAKEFVLKEKNNVIQSAKILAMIDSMNR